MTSAVLLTCGAIVVAVLAMMLLEAQLSRHNERVLRARGAIEPPDDVIGAMRVAYPLGFVLIGVAGTLNASLSKSWLLVGLAVFAGAKVLKFWAIASLGSRWSFRVLVVPGTPLVTGGPYRLLRHPNYLAVIGELGGIAIAVSAPVTGAVVVVAFGWLIRQRIKIEERALGLRR